MELYRTVLREAEAEQIIERSRFIAHIKPVCSREEADDFIAQIKGEYRDATHNVPAMVIGDKSQIQWASDDGEPQGTSGAPMVQMLVSEGITNVIIVVTRYFGGIKLGTGGLVRAYTSSAKLALQEAGICSVMEMISITTEIDYTYLAKLQKLSGGDFDIADAVYGEKVTLDLHAKAEDEEDIKGILMNLTSGSAVIKKTEKILAKKCNVIGHMLQK
ncbi:MAG: YigZ family protein [Bacillota bacterium]|nr:YigZ family protein [Bacillota bacterium]